MSSVRSKGVVGLLAGLGLLGSSGPAHAFVYPEHRDIALRAVERLDPERRALFDRFWAEARAGHEQRLCAQVADSQQGVAPEIKDIVRNSNRTETQDVFPDLHELQFQGVTGGDAGALLGGSTAGGCGQRATVYLAAGRQGQDR